MESTMLANIANNVFIMWGVIWLIEKVPIEIDVNIKCLIAFFIMMALCLWRGGE